LSLLNTSERVQSTLYIAKLLPIFEICSSEEEAVARFEKGPTPPHPREPH
jgi:hypothetical protein